jgi:hypothetical protein
MMYWKETFQLDVQGNELLETALHAFANADRV